MFFFFAAKPVFWKTTRCSLPCDNGLPKSTGSCTFSLPSCRDSTHLFAADALLGELLVVAGAAVNVASFGDETLRADWPLAGDTGEAVVVPRVAFVLHTLRTCHRASGREEHTGWKQSTAATLKIVTVSGMEADYHYQAHAIIGSSTRLLM